MLQAAKINRFGLKAKAVNGVTKDEAQRRGINIWEDVEAECSVILISPEMLASKSFEKLIKSKIFQDRLFAVGIDEVHLLLSWGGEFRPAFQQIAYMRARFKSSVVLFAMTATLLAGKHLQSLSKVLGLRKDKYTLLRRSNARPDIQLIFRTLNACAMRLRNLKRSTGAPSPRYNTPVASAISFAWDDLEKQSVLKTLVITYIFVSVEMKL